VNASSSSAAQSAADLNHLIYEALLKQDAQKLQCEQNKAHKHSRLVELQQVTSDLYARAAAAREAVFKTQSDVRSTQTQLKETHEDLDGQKTMCAKEESKLETMLDEMDDDMELMQQALVDARCTTARMMLLECAGKKAGEKFHSVSHAQWSRTLRRLKSPDAQALVNEGLSAGTTLSTKRRRSSFVMVNGVKCAKVAAINCRSMVQRFKMIKMSIEDKEEELEEKVRALKTRCQNTFEHFESQIQSLKHRLSDEQAIVASSTAELNAAEGELRLKEREHKNAKEEMKSTLAECKAWKEASETEVCGLRKLRAELKIVSSSFVQVTDSDTVQDCEVSEWVVEACSVTCGGGVQRMTRTVVAQPQNGAACPPLESQRACNPNPCPVDCVMGDWGGWSECSADCDGGIMQRHRQVQQEGLHGGLPCGEKSEATTCSAQPCNKNCMLGEWSDWGSCSKACNNGLQERRRGVAEEAVGLGTCPDPESDDRVGYQACNPEACLPADAPASSYVKCDAKLDVMLLVDGGIFTFDPDHWRSVRLAALRITKALPGNRDFSGAMVASMFYAGPRNENFEMCGLEEADTTLAQLRQTRHNKTIAARTERRSRRQSVLFIDGEEPAAPDHSEDEEWQEQEQAEEVGEGADADTQMVEDDGRKRMVEEQEDGDSEVDLAGEVADDEEQAPEHLEQGHDEPEYQEEEEEPEDEAGLTETAGGAKSISTEPTPAAKGSSMLNMQSAVGSAGSTDPRHCGIAWITRFGDRFARAGGLQVTRRVSRSRRPRGPSVTSMALTVAANDLPRGRQDAPAVVVVITGGMPSHLRDAKAAAERIRSRARLMFLVVGEADASLLDEYEAMASKPARDNVLAVPRHAVLQSEDTIDDIIATICPKVAEQRR